MNESNSSSVAQAERPVQIDIVQGLNGGRDPEQQGNFQEIRQGIEQQQKTRDDLRNMEEQIKQKQASGQLLSQQEQSWLQSSIAKAEVQHDALYQQENQTPPRTTQQPRIETQQQEPKPTIHVEEYTSKPRTKEEEEYFKKLMQDINKEDSTFPKEKKDTKLPTQQEVALARAASLKETMAEEKKEVPKVLTPEKQEFQNIITDMRSSIPKEGEDFTYESLERVEKLIEKYKQTKKHYQEKKIREEQIQKEDLKYEVDTGIEDTKEIKIGNLTPEIVTKALKENNPIEVKVERSDGSMEEKWVVTGINTNLGKARVFKFPTQEAQKKGEKTLYKDVSIEKLKEWNEIKEAEQESTSSDRGWDWLLEEDTPQKAKINEMVDNIYDANETGKNFGELKDTVDLVEELNLNKKSVLEAVETGKIRAQKILLQGGPIADEQGILLNLLNEADLGTVDLSTPENTQAILRALEEISKQIKWTEMSGPGKKGDSMNQKIVENIARQTIQALN